MALSGKLENEVELRSPATKFFNVFVSQLHLVQNITETVHEAKVHEGDWHNIGSVKHWTFTVDGKVTTCKESIEDIDHENKSITFRLFDGDLGEQYKSFKEKLQVIDKGNGALAKWTFEYEKAHEGVPPPHAFSDFIATLTKDVDAHILKEQQV